MAELPSPQFKRPELTPDIWAFITGRTQQRALCNLAEFNPGLPVYVRWAPEITSTEAQSELCALAHKLERHLAYIALCGLSAVPRAYAIGAHPDNNGQTLYTFSPVVTGSSLTTLHNSLATSNAAAKHFRTIGRQLGVYRQWAVQQGTLLYDIAGTDQYMYGSVNQEDSRTYLVDIEARFADFNERGASYIYCFDTQQASLEHTASLQQESERFANMIRLDES